MKKKQLNFSEIKTILNHAEMKMILGGDAPEEKCAKKGKYCGSDIKCCPGLTCDSGEAATCIVL
ncbi:MAG: hypothetical protein KDC15_10105 [Chitinophagaceae bacterium]|nr:hypothetical protein [Chitinophagaceae bacterium]